MSHTSYHTVIDLRRKGFRLKTRRFLIIPRLRVRFFYFLRFLLKCKWRFPHGQALKLVKRGILRTTGIISGSKFKDGDKDNLKRRMVSTSGCSSRYYHASSDAISDCLEYIKMSGVNPADDKTPLAAKVKQDNT